MKKKENQGINTKEKIKSFVSKHKGKIIGTMSLGAILVGATYLGKQGYENEELYDSLLQKREEVRMNPQSETWESDLRRIDEQLRSTPNPRREYCKTLTDNELEKHRNSAESIWTSAKEEFDEKTKGLSYDSYYNDPEKIELDKLYDSFYQAQLEKEHRYAKANPDKFPIHREHGWYLPNDD